MPLHHLSLPVPFFFHLINGIYLDPPGPFYSSCSLLQLTWANSCVDAWLLALVNPPQWRKFVTTTEPSGFFALMKYYINMSKNASLRKPYILSVPITVNQQAN